MADARFELLIDVEARPGRVPGWARSRAATARSRPGSARGLRAGREGWPTPDDHLPPDAGETPTLVAWRLLGGNNREMGRGAGVHLGAEGADRAIRRLLERQADLRPVCTVDVDTGLWLWRVEDDGEPLAVAARPYQRQRECRSNLDQFLSTLGNAKLPAGQPFRRLTAMPGAGHGDLPVTAPPLGSPSVLG